MKIQKIIKIQNVGKFKNYNASGNVTFNDFTIIYGENGKGKTTLCTILRSLKNGNALLLTEKKRVGSTEPMIVDVFLENKSIANFNETQKAWTTLNPEIEIFDSFHVNNNVYSGDHVDHVHRKNLYYLIIGDTGVEIAQEIEQIDVQIKGMSDQCKLKTSELKGKILSDFTIDSFLQIQEISDTEQKIRDIDKDISSLEESSKIQTLELLESILLPSFKIVELETLLQSSIDSVSNLAEQNVKKQCAKLDTLGEPWIKQGFDYVEEKASESCPFCGQKIVDLNLLHYYREYFNQAYSDLKEKISVFLDLFETDFPFQKLLDIQALINRNKLINTKWKSYVDTTDIDFDFEKLKIVRDELINAVQQLINQKKQNPLEVFEYQENLNKVVNNYEAVNKEIQKYNAEVILLNTQIANKKKTVASGNIEPEKAKRLRLIDTQTRFSEMGKKLCKDYQENLAELEKTKATKQRKTEELKEYSEKVLGKYRDTLNDYLLKFGTEFQVVEPKTSLQGGKPSANYMLRIENETIPLGTVETEGEPCFRTILSDGDKNSLAFAFFMAQLKLDPDLKNKTIIIDDPITSLDINRKHRTYEEIKFISQLTKQMIVLSHDAFFLKLFSDNLPNVRTLEIKRKIDSSELSEWDVDMETLPSYLRDYYRLVGFVDNGEKDLLGVVRCIRPVLEGYLRFRFPKSFGIKVRW